MIDSKASFPQAPYDSTTNGTQTHPSSLHLPSLEQCFLCSVIHAATPVVTLTSNRIVGLSGDVTDRSKAAGLPKAQFGTKEVSRTSVAVTGGDIATHFHLDTQNELANRTLKEYHVVCCGEKPHQHPFAGNSMMAKWVQSNLRAQWAASTKRNLQAKPPLNGNLKLGRVEMETETL